MITIIIITTTTIIIIIIIIIIMINSNNIFIIVRITMLTVNILFTITVEPRYFEVPREMEKSSK